LPPRQAKHAPTVLHLFSGPTMRADGLRAHLASLGWDCSDHDIVNVSEDEPLGQHDLSSDQLWSTITADLTQGQYAAVVMGTPCETASRARNGPPGPRPLRSAAHIYGLPKSQLTKAEHDQVRQGTYFALQSAKLAQLACQLRIPWVIENPDPAGNPCSLFNLPEWLRLAATPGVQHLDFHQCALGAESTKPTRLLFYLVDVSALAGKCNHTRQHWQFTDLRGHPRTTFAAHPPLAGRRREDGTFATKAAAAWPGEMNRRLAHALANTWPGPHPPLYGTSTS